MDVRMPDGTVITNVPEGTTKSELSRRLGLVQNQNTPQTPTEAPGRPEASPGVSPPQTPVSGAMGQSEGSNERGTLGSDALTASTRNMIPFSDEIVGRMAAPFRAGYRAFTGEDEGKGLWERLQTATDIEVGKQRERQKQSRKEHPVASTLGELGGGLAIGGGASKAGLTFLNVAKPTVPRMVGAGMAEGAAYGGLYGAAEGEGAEDRLARAGAGATVGALTGGAMGAAGGVGAKIAARSQAAKEIPGVEALEIAKREAYKEVDKLGATYKPEAYNKLLAGIEQTLTKAKLHPARHPKAASMLEQLKGESGKRMPLSELDQWRQVARRDVANAADDAERFMGQKTIDAIDDFVANAQVGDMTRRTSAKAASNAILKARTLNTRWRKAEIIEDALIRAQRQANSAGSGGNINNAIRQQFKTILNNKKLSRSFTESERTMMDKIVQGGRLDNFARRIGKLSPEGNGLMLALQGLGALHTGGASIPIMIGAAGAKRFADTATQRGVSKLAQSVQGGATPQLPALSQRARGVLSGATATLAPQSDKAVTPAQAGPVDMTSVRMGGGTEFEQPRGQEVWSEDDQREWLTFLIEKVPTIPSKERHALIRKLFGPEGMKLQREIFGPEAAEKIKEQVLTMNLRSVE